MLNNSIAYVLSHLEALRREERGATAVEYALVVGLVSILVVGALALFVPKIETFVNGITFG